MIFTLPKESWPKF